jgi:hypothetical protein
VVLLLGISLQMDLDSNDVPERTGLVRIRTKYYQPYVTLNTFQARVVGDIPAVIRAVNDL